MHNPNIKKGILEMYCGPMRCGKTKSMLDRVEPLNFMSGLEYIFIKPNVDTRDTVVKSNNGMECPCNFVDEKDPYEILSLVEDKHHIIAIDEIQLFYKGIGEVITALLLKGKNVLGGGLDLDFRGEPFGEMPYLLSIANEVHKLTAVCQYQGCNMAATKTQRLINEQPAQYHSPILSIEGENMNETYEPRCLEHHIVPGRPSYTGK